MKERLSNMLKGISACIVKTIPSVIKGAIIGCANIIPGVSGGTVAVSMGVFDTIILSVNGMIGKRGERKEHILALLPLLTGVIIGLVVFSKLIDFLFQYAPLPTFTAFLGMVLGSLPLLAKNSLKEGFHPLSIMWFLLAAGLVLLMQFTQGGIHASESYTIWSAVALMIVMMIAAASMVMPGLSGSFVMLLFGRYEMAINALANYEWLKLLPMIVGALLGIVLVAKLMARLLKNHYASTYAAIIGFVFGSVVVMIMRTAEYFPASGWRIVIACLTLIGGIALTLLSQRKDQKST